MKPTTIHVTQIIMKILVISCSATDFGVKQSWRFGYHMYRIVHNKGPVGVKFSKREISEVKFSVKK